MQTFFLKRVNLFMKKVIIKVKNKKIVISALVFFIAMPFVISGIYLNPLVDRKTVKAVQENPLRYLHLEGAGKFVLTVPDVRAFFNNLKKNPKMKAMLKSRAGKDLFSFFPLKAMGMFGKISEVLPYQFQERVFLSLIPDGFYYASNRNGFTLLMPMNKASERLIKSKIKKNMAFAVQDGWFVLAHNQKILKAQLEKLKSPPKSSLESFSAPVGSMAFRMEAREKSGSIFGFGPNVKNEKNIFISLYRTLFPDAFIKNQQFTITPFKKGIRISSTSSLTDKGKLLSRQLDIGNDFPVLDSLPKQPIAVMESPVSMNSWLAYFKGKDSIRAKGHATLLTYHGLIADYGIMVPSLGLHYDRNAEVVTNFLEKAFMHGKYKIKKEANNFQVQFSRYQWNKKNAIYNFSPRIDYLKRITFSTDKNAQKELVELLRQVSKKGSSVKKILSKAKPKAGEKPILVFRSRIDVAISQLAQTLKKISPVYYPSAFKDLQENLEKVNFPQSGYQGVYLLSQENLRLSSLIYY